jgi:hypothetical protein
MIETLMRIDANVEDIHAFLIGEDGEEEQDLG